MANAKIRKVIASILAISMTMTGVFVLYGDDITVKATKIVGSTKIPRVTSSARIMETSSEEATQSPSSTSNPTETPGSPSPIPTASSGVSDFAIASFTSNKAAPQEVGSAIVLTLKGTGGTGKYTYKFYVVNTETLHEEIYTGWTSTNTVTWIPTEEGKYQIHAYICDDGSAEKEIKNVVVDYQITSALTVKTFKATKMTKRKVKFTMKAEGKSPVKYKLMVVNGSGKKTTIKNYSGTRTKVYTFKQVGTYTIYLYVKDGSNKVKKVKKVLQIK